MGTDIDPIKNIQQWMDEAEQSEVNDANAMSLATTGADMMPDVRIILLKEIAPEGLYFYTNQNSTKSQQLEENAKAAICLHWKSSRRQIRARGIVTKASEAKSDAYFASRHPISRRGAWASQQSEPLASREVFESQIEAINERFPDDNNIPRPPHWGGYILEPLSIEFWEEKEYRLHTRTVFTRNNADDNWASTLLYP